MTDIFSKEKRSQIMAAVKSKNTSIELLVRKTLHRMGYRYRIANRHLPGNPDLTFRKLRIAVFVNGCFWHGHSCKRGNRIPKANRDYWIEKINRNVERDQRVHAELIELGWKVCVIWECEIEKGMDEVIQLLVGSDKNIVE